MELQRTPDRYFEELDHYDFTPHYCDISDEEGNQLRIHYVDEGEGDQTLVLMHGEPTWSYLYRHMIPPLVAAGYRVLAPDLIGFGRSDKPTNRNDYSYRRHVDWMKCWMEGLQLENVTLFCQDWGGLIGLRLVVTEAQRFSRVITANTFLPTGEHPPSDAFVAWRNYSQEVHSFPVSNIVQGGSSRTLSEAEQAAYDAPFPNESYKSGARQFPILVPTESDNPEALLNKQLWQQLEACNRPWLTLFSDQDPVTAGADRIFQAKVPGCQNQQHKVMKGGGHFLQEDCSEGLCEAIIDFINANPC